MTGSGRPVKIMIRTDPDPRKGEREDGTPDLPTLISLVSFALAVSLSLANIIINPMAFAMILFPILSCGLLVIVIALLVRSKW